MFLNWFFCRRPSLSCDQRGETALHMAARAGQVEVVRCLLRNGAMVDARARVRRLSISAFMSCFFLRYKWNYHHFNTMPSLSFHCGVCRRTRLLFTLRHVWEKQRSFSCCCSTWPILTLPPPMATLPFTSQPGRGRWRRPLCFWRPGLHIHSPPRYMIHLLIRWWHFLKKKLV